MIKNKYFRNNQSVDQAEKVINAAASHGFEESYIEQIRNWAK